MDWVGAGLATVRPRGSIVYGLLGPGGADGAGDEARWSCSAAGVALLVAFVLVEARVRMRPWCRLSLFRSRTFAGANLLTLLLYAALGGAPLLPAVHLIQVQGYCPPPPAPRCFPCASLISAMSPWPGGLARAPRCPPAVCRGPADVGGGFRAACAARRRADRYWTTFFPGVVVLGVGWGHGGAAHGAVMGSVERHAGVASGVNNAVSRAAGLLAVAALGLVLLVRFDRSLDQGLTQLALPAEVVRAIDLQRGKLAAAELPGLARLFAP